MKRTSIFARTLLVLAGSGAVVGMLALAEPPKGGPAAGGGAPPEMKLPKGWTPEDMQACMDAGTPGKMHAQLAKQVGVWHGKCQMWMGPDGGEPMSSDCVNTVTSVMEGRYIKADMAGDMPGMGPFMGMGITGFDNVSQKFVGTWIDNHSSGIMNGVGELSKDGKTTNWVYNQNCPITKKPTTMREVQAWTGDNSMTLEMFAKDPKSGKEYQCMKISFTRKP